MKKFFGKYKKLIRMILFTALGLLIWQIGLNIQFPFVGSNSSIIDFGFLDVFTGGGLSSLSILSLGISPYITASIVVEMLQLDVVPQFKEWADEGEEGREKLNRWTRYIALFIAFVQALATILGYKAYENSGYAFFYNQGSLNAFTYIYIALVITAGTAFTMWLADQITMHGIGNGSSMLITAGILVSLPKMLVELGKYFLSKDPNENPNYLIKETLTIKWQGIVLFIVLLLVFLGIIVGVVWMEGLQRKIPVQYANRPSGSKLVGQQGSDIPIKLNSASVIPVIFASTLLSLPMTILQFVAEISGKNSLLSDNSWWNMIFNYTKPIGFAIYIILIFVFAFFYSFLQIDPDKMADNLKKQNANIIGVKPGEATAVKISTILFKVTLLGATYLAVLASIPIIITWIFPAFSGTSITIGGTSIMIVVGVALETVKQIKAEGQSQDYQGFM